MTEERENSGCLRLGRRPRSRRREFPLLPLQAYDDGVLMAHPRGSREYLKNSLWDVRERERENMFPVGRVGS